MKSKIVVVYKTKYGSTKRYAEWIAQKTGADIFDLSSFDLASLDGYDSVLFGSSVLAGTIKNIDFVKKNWQTLKKKKVVVFASSGSPSDDPGQQKVFEASLPKEIREKVTYFPLHGAMDYNKLDFTDKLLTYVPRTQSLFQWWFRRDQKAKKFLDNFCTPQDWTSESAINSIVKLFKQ